MGPAFQPSHDCDPKRLLPSEVFAVTIQNRKAPVWPEAPATIDNAQLFAFRNLFAEIIRRFQEAA